MGLIKNILTTNLDIDKKKKKKKKDNFISKLRNSLEVQSNILKLRNSLEVSNILKLRISLNFQSQIDYN